MPIGPFQRGGFARPSHLRARSSTRRAALKLQGQYMALLRRLTPKPKAQVKAVREREAAGNWASPVFVDSIWIGSESTMSRLGVGGEQAPKQRETSA